MKIKNIANNKNSLNYNLNYKKKAYKILFFIFFYIIKKNYISYTHVPNV